MSQVLNKMFYVYGHYRETDGALFYIGKGQDKRAWSKSGRSNHWRNIVKKNGYFIRLIHETECELEAYKLEIKEILEARTKGRSICNIANGGEGGLSGIPMEKYHKDKLRDAKLGKSQMPEHARKSAMARVGQKNTKEHIENTVKHKRKMVINSNGHIFASASAAARDLKCSQGNISMCARGERRECKGLSWSYDITKAPEAPKPLAKMVKNITLDQWFSSLKCAVEFIESERGSATQQSISLSARTGSQAYGYHWSYE